MVLFWKVQDSTLIFLASQRGQRWEQKRGSLSVGPKALSVTAGTCPQGPAASPLPLSTLLGFEENGTWSWKKDGGWRGLKRPDWEEILQAGTSFWLTED